MPLDLDKKTKERSSDRVFVLREMEGKSALSTSGLIDRRVFTGENSLHAIMDPMTCLWSAKYTNGAILPTPLKQKFTSFRMLYNFAEEYFKRRNIEIVEVLD